MKTHKTLMATIASAAVLILGVGVTFALTQITKDVPATVAINLRPVDGIEVYLDEGLTQQAETLSFGTIEVDFFGTTEAQSVPIWVHNRSLSTVRLSVGDNFNEGDVDFDKDGAALVANGTLGGTLSLDLPTGVRGDFDFTISFNAEGPIASPTWIDRYVQSPGYDSEWGQPNTGGILKYGASHIFAGHDPNYGHSFEGPQFLPIYNALLRFDPWVGVAGAIEGDLAETWSISSDGLAVTFNLREGVKFQDNPNLPSLVAAKVSGDEFTCEDAKASLDFAINPPSVFTNEGLGHTGPKAALGHMSANSCPDGDLGHTFKVEFDAPLARTIAQFAGARGMPNNMDKDFLDWLYESCVTCLDYTTPENHLRSSGTGAFVPTEFQPDVLTKVRRNPTYFRDGLPLLDGMDQFIITDGAARFTALLTGQIDYFGEGSASLLASQVEQIQQSYSDEIHVEPVLHSWGKGIQINMNRDPFDDVRVRQAMHLAIDRDAWVDFNLAGDIPGVMRPTNWMPPGTGWALPDDELMSLPGWRRGVGKDADIAEANRLLDEALGDGVRFDIECMAQNSQIYIDGCQFFQDQMKNNLNVDVTTAFVDSGTQTDRGINEDYDAHFGSKVTTNVGDPDDYYYLSVVPETESYYYKNTGAFNAHPDWAAELEAMVRAQSGELDVSKRQDLVRDIERKLATEYFFQIPFPWTYIFPAWSKDVRGWTLGPFPSQVKWAQWERAWLSR